MATPRRAAPDAPAWRMNIIRTGTADPRTLLPNPQNWRKHPALQSEAVAGALHTLGWLKRIIVNDRTGHLLDGHLRVALALQHGQAVVPVDYADLTPEEEALALLTLDPSSALATADPLPLAALMQLVTTEDRGLQRLLEGLAVEAHVIPPAPGGLGAAPPWDADDPEEDVPFETAPQDAPGSQVHMVQLFLTEASYPAFKQAVDTLGAVYGLATLTDTVVACVQRAAAQEAPGADADPDLPA
jgi:hypothetical protein